MLFDFFFDAESGPVVLAKTDWLSPYTKAGPLILIPIILPCPGTQSHGIDSQMTQRRNIEYNL